jgi:hypothetical protein
VPPQQHTPKHTRLCRILCGTHFLARQLRPHLFASESFFTHVASTYRGNTTLCFLSTYLAESLGHFEFNTLSMSSSAFCEGQNFPVQGHPTGRMCRIGTREVFFETKKLDTAIFFFKPLFKQLGSYGFHQSLCSRGSCSVPDLGSKPK